MERDDNSFWRNVKGMLQMKVCGVNSQWVKNLVIERAKKLLNHILQISWKN